MHATTFICANVFQIYVQWTFPARREYETSQCLSEMIIIYGTVSSCHAKLSGVPHSDSVHISTRWGATCVDCELSITRGTDHLYYFMQFSTPAVWNYLYSFPVTFLSYYVRSVDGRNHTVRLYYDNSAEVPKIMLGTWFQIITMQGTVSDNSHFVVWERVNVSQNYDTMRIGNFHQVCILQNFLYVTENYTILSAELLLPE